MAEKDGIIVDLLYLGCTRPTGKWGVTYTALIINFMVTFQTFIFTRNLLYLLLFIPLHLICYLICLNDPRTFDLLLLWGRTKGVGYFGNLRFWKANSYSPLELDVYRHKKTRKVFKYENAG